MKKYFRALICIIYSIFRFCCIKIFNFKGFKFTLINIISPFTQIEIGKKSKLFIGKGVRMRSGCKIRVRKNSEIYIGDKTGLNHGCIFTAHKKIKIGKNVKFGPNVLIYDHDHDYKTKDGLRNLDYITSSVEIGDNTWIGANVIILKGTKIGKNCVVAAGTILSNKGNTAYPDNTLIYQKRDTTTVIYEYI